MKKTQFSLTTSSTNKQPMVNPYRTFNSFPRAQNFQQPSRSCHNPDESFDEGQVEIIKMIVQSQMTNTLKIIKVEIETKIKDIDDEIRGIRQEVFKLKQADGHDKLAGRVKLLEKMCEGLKASLENQQASRANIIPETRNNEILARNRSERSLSRQRKRIFQKPEPSINLSNILFPDEDSQRLKKSNISENKQELDIFLRPSYVLEKVKHEQPQDEAVEVHQPQDSFKQDLLLELNRNKNQFLRNKSKPSPTDSPQIPTSPFQVTVSGGVKANQTILQQSLQQSIHSSANRNRM